MIKVTWNPKTDYTNITYSEEFTQLDDVAKIDILGDTMFELHGEYIKALGETQEKYGKGARND